MDHSDHVWSETKYYRDRVVPSAIAHSLEGAFLTDIYPLMIGLNTGTVKVRLFLNITQIIILVACSSLPLSWNPSFLPFQKRSQC